MLPVALLLGESGEARAPLGAVLIGGMVTSTFLSLLYVPIAYTYFDSFGQLMNRLVGWRSRLPFRRAAASKTPPTPPARAMLPVAGGAPTQDEPARIERRPSRWLRRRRKHHRPASHHAHRADGPADQTG
jgi:hypothetical protein